MSRNDESICSNARNSRLLFASAHLAWCVKEIKTAAAQIKTAAHRAGQGWWPSFERLPPTSWVVVVGLGVGTMVVYVPYCCAAVLCLWLSLLLLLLLLLFCCLSMFTCARWCALSSKRHGARSRVRDASHRRQHCCARIEDRAHCGVKLHLEACCSWVGRWDDGGLGAVLPLRCCVLLVVAVVFGDVVLFLLVSMFACESS